MKTLLCAALLLLALPAAAVEPPDLTFEADAVLARGVTPKGRVAWFSVAREISREATTVVPRAAVRVDEDGDGAVRFDLGQEVPLRSLWFAVDLETGAAAVAAPEDFPLLEVDFPGDSIPAALHRLELRRAFIHALLVRPGTGAWSLRVGDGGASDEDGEPDGTLRAPLAAFAPVGDGPPPPERFSPRDILLVVDPDRMEFLTVRIGG